MTDFLYELSQVTISVVVAAWIAANLFGLTIGFMVAIDRGACEYDRLWFFAAPATIVGCELGEKREWGSK